MRHQDTTDRPASPKRATGSCAKLSSGRRDANRVPFDEIGGKPVRPQQAEMKLPDVAGEDTHLPREMVLTILGIAVTLGAAAMFAWDLVDALLTGPAVGLGGRAEQVLLGTIICALIYGNLVYQLARLGFLKRRRAHRAASREELEQTYLGRPPRLVVLVPSYKEDMQVVRQTLLSAALQDYPDRRVVLLIDDPPDSEDPQDVAGLRAARALPGQIQSMLEAPAGKFRAALWDYCRRRHDGNIDLAQDARRLAQLYGEAAAWFESQAAEGANGTHTDALFRELVFAQPGQAHRRRASELTRHARLGGVGLTAKDVLREYRRLAAMFDVELTSFERKRYVNLSHEPNKAMNLNSYIGLLGGSYREIRRHDGLHCEQADPEEAQYHAPQADYIITLDADSLLTSDYALRLVPLMEQPGNERIAVAQTPYSAIPHPPGVLERVAGATTDVQYIIHQGFTQYRATYWVGANALLRHEALKDIAEPVEERGYTVTRYIQDRTVIEDSESSVDLIDRGWRLYNYPARLAYSATPPDFGSLLIQRRRWSNGGLIILPKLLRYLFRRGPLAGRVGEGFMRIHYLISNAAVNVALLAALAYPFGDSLLSWWLPLTALPYFTLYARDMIRIGYRKTDIFRVYSLNLMLIPVNLGGVCKSLQQAWTKRKIPFGRTPKIKGRTASPAFYVLAVYSLLVHWLSGAAWDAAAGRWLHAGFALANAAMLLYAVVGFIGLREGWQDVRLGWHKYIAKRRARKATVAQPTADRVPRTPGESVPAPSIGAVAFDRPFAKA